MNPIPNANIGTPTASDGVPSRASPPPMNSVTDTTEAQPEPTTTVSDVQAESPMEVEHGVHDWVVDAELRAPTHALDRCTLCRQWIEHARDCARHCWERFEQA
ncbi:hypothetical protein BDV93DRAFT_566820 [Ceratobasidium sp. AG-I]|nr:hypothetical protein BDV93DRAFT_566820 [Ceratobasidium sp. AG-I]